MVGREALGIREMEGRLSREKDDFKVGVLLSKTTSSVHAGEVTEADTVGRKQDHAAGWTTPKLDHAVGHGRAAAEQFHPDAPHDHRERQRQHEKPPRASKASMT